MIYEIGTFSLSFECVLLLSRVDVDRKTDDIVAAILNTYSPNLSIVHGMNKC